MDSVDGPKWVKKGKRIQCLTSNELAEKLNSIRTDDVDEETSQSESTVGPFPKKKNASSRSSAKRVAPILLKFCSKKKELLQEMGYQDFVHLPGIRKMDRGYTVHLLMNIDCDNRTLQIDPNMKIPLCSSDLQMVMGTPCGKLPVCGLGTDDPEDQIDFIRLCIGSGGVETYNSLETAEKNVMEDWPDEVRQEKADQFKRSLRTAIP